MNRTVKYFIQMEGQTLSGESDRFMFATITKDPMRGMDGELIAAVVGSYDSQTKLIAALVTSLAKADDSEVSAVLSDVVRVLGSDYLLRVESML